MSGAQVGSMEQIFSSIGKQFSVNRISAFFQGLPKRAPPITKICLQEEKDKTEAKECWVEQGKGQVQGLGSEQMDGKNEQYSTGQFEGVSVMKEPMN